MKKVVVHWFRRDLRLKDNHALFEALNSGFKVLPIFIFDTNILEALPPNDHRITFIHHSLEKLNEAIISNGGAGIKYLHTSPLNAFKELTSEHQIQAVFCNEDYEPYARERDTAIKTYLEGKGISFTPCTDHVLNHPNEVLKADGSPYSVFTPYKNKVLQHLAQKGFPSYASEKHLNNFFAEASATTIPSIEQIGFKASNIPLPTHNYSEELIAQYAEKRDFPAARNTSRLSTHLRFGLISTRGLAKKTAGISSTYLNELIWRDFYQMILWHHPISAQQSFKKLYDQIEWVNNPALFEKWCAGKTGFPIVDAGMRELNATGFMHNRVRMIVASFLCKDLQIDWRWGEAYFAEKLYDFELASNVGGWQWAASSGCDAAPYFRIFNSELQQKRFDPNFEYIKKWVPEYGTNSYPEPIVEHKKAKALTLAMYEKALKS